MSRSASLFVVVVLVLSGASQSLAELIFQRASAEGFDVEKGMQIGTVSMAGIDAYTLTFRIKPLDVVPSWASILHIGDRNLEVRQPGLWLYPGKTRLHHRQVTDQGNSGLDPGRNLPMSEWTDVAIVWSTESAGLISRVYYGDDLVAEESIGASMSIASSEMPVFAGDPWHTPASARLSDVRLYNTALSLEEIQWTRSLAELYGTPVFVEPRQMEFDGQTNHSKGTFQLSSSFYVRAHVRIDASEQWNHLIEVGSLEYHWNGPLRVEVGEEGEWYVSVGDGQSFSEVALGGNWSYGDWVLLEVEYKDGTVRLWEDGEQLGSMQADKRVEAVDGTLNIGSFAPGERYFRGAIRGLQIRELP